MNMGVKMKQLSTAKIQEPVRHHEVGRRGAQNTPTGTEVNVLSLVDYMI